MKRIALCAVVALALLYVGDFTWVWLRVHHPQAGAAFGSVDVYYETPLKNGKDEFFFGQANKQTCVKSIFPQMGYAPCWFASRRSVRSVELKSWPLREISLPIAIPPIPFEQRPAA